MDAVPLANVTVTLATDVSPRLSDTGASAAFTPLTIADLRNQPSGARVIPSRMGPLSREIVNVPSSRTSAATWREPISGDASPSVGYAEKAKLLADTLVASPSNTIWPLIVVPGAVSTLTVADSPSLTVT